MPSRPPSPPSRPGVPRAAGPQPAVAGPTAPRTAVVRTPVGRPIAPRTAAVPRTRQVAAAPAGRRPTPPGRPQTTTGTAPRTPQELARARARAKATAARARAELKAGRKATARARRRAALIRWTHRTGTVAAALLVALVGAVVMSGVEPGAPAAASAPLDLTAQATALRDELIGTTTELQTAQAAVGAAQGGLATAEQDLDTAAAALVAARAAVGTGAADLYSGTLTDRAAGAGYLVGSDVAAAGSLAVLAERADQRLTALTAAADSAAAAAAVAARRVDTAAATLATAQQQVTEVTAAARQRAAGTDLAVTAALSGTSTAAPTAADVTARTAWQDRLSALRAAGITLPTARQLLDGDLPDGLTPAHDAAGATVPGVASGVVDGAVVAVPSAEAAAAVSFAFAQLGTPYVPGGTTPAGMDCAGLAASVWTAAGTAVGGSLADQWSAGSIVPADRLQAGDLVFGVDTVAGLADVGVYVGDGQVVTASAVGYQVTTAALPAGATGVRVTVPASTPTGPPPGTGTLPATCGAVTVPIPATPVDPAWGGYSNGRIPASALCPVGDGQRLRCDAAAAYTQLARAFQHAFDTPLCITDSYRSFDAQQDAHERKPRITAVPGTSNHGWGLAVDLCGGVNGFGSPQHEWMTRYAGQFGWVHPDWAQATGENPEPWHWEFGLLAD